MLEEINFQLKLCLTASIFFCLKNIEGHGDIFTHLENLVGGSRQKPSVTNLSHKHLATWLYVIDAIQ